VRVEPIAADAYVREVLPETFALWGGRRTFERYVTDFRELAESAYGRRRHFTVGLRENGRIVCSCKNYARDIRWQGVTLRATGIGAVFTPPALRGRGLASVMLGALLDSERDAGRDVAFLYSDIHPAFYERLGFHELPSRLLSLRAASLDGSRAGGTPFENGDWAGVRKCFEALDSERTWSFRRTPVVWNWMRRSWNETPADGSQPVHLVVRRGRSVIAYAIGRRVLRQDSFVLDDFAFDGSEGRALLPALVRAGAGDLARVRAWLPPPAAREALPRGSVRARKDAVLMVVPLTQLARSWWKAVKEETLTNAADPCWSADHI